MSQTLDLLMIKKALKDFSIERDWEKFHNPKNLTMALSVEVSELVEIFQWVNDGGENIAIKDIFNYLVKLVDILDIDLEKVSLEKIKVNAKKYPVNKVKGRCIKYSDL